MILCAEGMRSSKIRDQSQACPRQERLLGTLRLLFVLATEHTLLYIFFNIWRQILFPGDLHDDAP